MSVMTCSISQLQTLKWIERGLITNTQRRPRG